MAMDRNDKEKEMVAFLLSTLYADVIDPPEVYRGFNKLVASADNLSVDIPDAVDEAVEVGLINTTQVTKGFSRIIDSVEDLSLDIPEARSVLQSFISKVAYE
uniref:MI domain-containing protein n=1 Tax=Brassica oleracea var. oleracea TaxID=109376 RepID=A0A0D3D7A2_BRAOL